VILLKNKKEETETDLFVCFKWWTQGESNP